MTSCMWLDLKLAMENLRPISDSGGCFGIALRFGSLGYNRQSLHELCKWQFVWFQNLFQNLFGFYPAIVRTGMQQQLCRGVLEEWTACKIERGYERIWGPGCLYLWSDLEALPMFGGCCEGNSHFVVLSTFVCMTSAWLRCFTEDWPILVDFGSYLHTADDFAEFPFIWWLETFERCILELSGRFALIWWNKSWKPRIFNAFQKISVFLVVSDCTFKSWRSTSRFGDAMFRLSREEQLSKEEHSKHDISFFVVVSWQKGTEWDSRCFVFFCRFGDSLSLP